MGLPRGSATLTTSPGCASPRSTTSLEKIQGCPSATRPAPFEFTRTVCNSVFSHARRAMVHARLNQARMAIIPTVRCASMKASIAFYTRILDFEWIDGDDDQSDPSYCMLVREGASLILSSHRGDGTFGQAIVVQTDIEALFRNFRARGLRTPGRYR